jgi:long-subunit acyl-CoA synthetase (AMP-forming)
LIRVPHILNRIRETAEKTVKQSGGLQQLLYRRAINIKLRWLREGRVVSNSWWDKWVLANLRSNFGGRLI